MEKNSESKVIWWLPTFGFFIFMYIQLCVFEGLTHGMGDPATPRHMRSGMMISSTGEIPHNNWLGFENPGLPWVDFEWGFETLIITVYQWGGAPLLTMMLYGLYGLTVLGIHRTLLKTGVSMPVTTLVTVTTGLTLIMHFNVRPPMITYLFLALIVEVWRMRPTVPLLQDWICLPIICCFWVSLHGGWIAAFLFLGLSFTGRFLDMLLGQTKWDYDRLVPWLGLIVLCGLATLINPWGWYMPIHLGLMTLTFKSFALWDEYHVPDFSVPTLSAAIILLYMAVTLGTRLLKKAPIWSLEVGLPMLLFTYFAFKAQRHAMLLVVVAAVPIARDLEFVLREHILKGWDSLSEWMDDFQERQRTAGGDAILCVMAWLSVSFIYIHFGFAKKDPDIGSSRVDQGVVDYIKAHPQDFKRPLTTTSNGGPLLWLARPDFRAGFDDRGDLYGDKEVFAQIALEYAQGEWKDTLAKGHYDSAIIDANLPLAQLLAYEPGWTLVYPSKEEVTKLVGTDNPFVATPPSAAKSAVTSNLSMVTSQSVSSNNKASSTSEANLQKPSASDSPTKNQMFIFVYHPDHKSGSG